MAERQQLYWMVLFVAVLYAGAGARVRARCLAAVTGTPTAVWFADAPFMLAVACAIAGGLDLCGADGDGPRRIAEVALAICLAVPCAVGAIACRRLHPYALASLLVLTSDAMGLRLVAAVIVAAGMLLLQGYEREMCRIWVAVAPQVEDRGGVRVPGGRSRTDRPSIRFTQTHVAGLRSRAEDRQGRSPIMLCTGCMTACGTLAIYWAAALLIAWLWPDRELPLPVHYAAGIASWCAALFSWTTMHRAPSERSARELADLSLRLVPGTARKRR